MARRSAWLASAALGALLSGIVHLPNSGHAQAIWQSATTDYNTAANWSTNNVPDAGGEAASFQNTGTASVVVNAAVAPDGWTFAANAQSYTVTGAAVTLGAAGLINNSAVNQSIANNIGGTASLVQNGAATLTLMGNNTYSGGTMINGGVLSLAQGATLAAGGNLFVAAGATLDTAGQNLIIGDLTGAGTINLNGNAVVFPGRITVGTANSTTFAGTINAPGGLIGTVAAFTKQGSGTLTMSGHVQVINTIVQQGTLQLGASNVFTGIDHRLQVETGARFDLNGFDQSFAQVSGAGNISLGLGRLTVFGTTTPSAIDGIVGGSGGVTVATAGGSLVGGLALNGINTYTGATVVDSGVLTVNGSIASSSLTTVNAGGRLGGRGVVGNTLINGGTLAPGQLTSALTVQGNLAFTTASTYLIQITPNFADRTNVTGTATLGGATVSAQYQQGSYVPRRYTILNAAGGVNGTFGTLVNTSLPAGFTPSLSYDASNVYLDLALNIGSTPNNPGGSGLNGNQASVARGLTNSFNAAGGIPLVFGALTPQGLTQVSGEAATGTQQTTFDAMGQFTTMLLDPFLGERGMGGSSAGASAYAEEGEANAYASKGRARSAAERDAYAAIVGKAPPRGLRTQPWSVWGAGYGGTQSTDGNAAAGSADTRSRIYGGAAGLDYRLTPDTLIGFSLGGAGTNYSLANGLGSGSSEMFQAGVYGRHNFGAAYLAAALAYGWQDVTTDRTVFLNGYRARFDANALSGRLEAGYRFATGAGGLTPYAAGQFTTFFLPDYAEQVVAGVNTFALAYSSRDVTASRSELGLRGDTSFALTDAVLTLRGRAAWAHNFNTDRSVSAIFQTLPASAFVVNGAAQAQDAALVTASAETRWLNGLSVAATFEGEFSRVTESYAGKGVIRYQW